MDQFDRGFVAEDWTWQTFASWFVPPLVFPTMLVVVLAEFVMFHAGN